jgi:hypothetical protein
VLLADALEHLFDELVVSFLDASDLLFYPQREFGVKVLNHALGLD